MENVCPPYEVLLSEVELELDTCIDELSRECAALVLEEPLEEPMETMDLFDAETIGNITTSTGPHIKKPVEDLKNQVQVMEERLEEIVLDIENRIWDENEDCKGTGVFIPKAMKVEIPKRSKGTGVFISNAYDLPKKKGGQKKSRIQIKKKKSGKPTTQYVQVSSKICLPEEWSYECYL